MRRRPSVLVELGVVEQRTKAVYEVLDGASVTEVARRYGVCRQTVHEWLHKYANEGSQPSSTRRLSPRLARIRPDFGGSELKVLFTRSRCSGFCPTNRDRA